MDSNHRLSDVHHHAPSSTTAVSTANNTTSSSSTSTSTKISPVNSLNSQSSASPTLLSRKSASADPGISSADVHRSSVSLPANARALATKLIATTSPSQSPENRSDQTLVALEDEEKTPTIAPSTRMAPVDASFMLPDPAVISSHAQDPETDSKRLSFSSLYSAGSSVPHSQQPASVAGSEPEVSRHDALSPPTTAHSNIAVTASTHNGTLGVSPQSIQSVHSADNLSASNRSAQSIASVPAASTVPRQSSYTRASSAAQQRSRSKTRADRRVSRSVAASNASPAGDRPIARESEKKKAPNGVIGVCALDTKARSKPSRNILNRLIANGEFDVIIFGDKIILDEEVENWPVCDYLISFFSEGFPLDKAIAYAKLRKPFCVNDLPMQTILWDRRLCLMILDSFEVLTPKRLEVNRDGGPKIPSPELATHLRSIANINLPGADDGTGGDMPPPKDVHTEEDGDVLVVDGKQLRKPFVEKPVSGEDHNIHIYFAGGGGRRLFRKVNNKSSEGDDDLCTPRAITEPENSYIYEEFIEAAKAEDVKAYTVGPDFCHAETRKSPVVDGIVKRNPNGKELRYVTELTSLEREMASRVVRAFGQTVCGFDMLRSSGKSFIIDVNGWSFVKDNPAYYDQCAKILREMFIKEKQRLDLKHLPQEVQITEEPSQPELDQEKNTSTHRSLRDIFKSPSMAKLTHHPHILHPHRGSTIVDSVPISSPPSIDLRNRDSLAPASQPANIIVPASDTTSMSERQGLSRASSQRSPVPPPASKAQWRLKGMVSVVRHADRTPKQKFKFTFHTKPFVDLLRGHQEEVLLVGEAALNSVLEAVQLAISEGKEDMYKLQLLRTSLIKKGAWSGTKVQIKPMFRSRRPTDKESTTPTDQLELKPDQIPSPEHRESAQTVTLSRIAAAENSMVLDKLQLIIKWGGEPTHSARYQAQDLGDNLRNDLLLMNRECLEHVNVFSSSERRVTTSAQIFASSFLEEKDLPNDFIQVRKDLLDDSNAAKDEMDKVKKKLKQLLREGDAAPPEFAWPKGSPEPYIVARRIVELMQFHHAVMTSNYQKLQTSAASALAAALRGHMSEVPGSQTTSPTGSMTSAQMVANIQPRWCSGEDADLFRERWEKLFKEFTDADKVDPSKVSELYDTLKFDALHNRQFLEWVFMPDMELEGSIYTDVTTTPEIPAPSRSGTVKSSARRSSFTREDQTKNPKDWKVLAQRIGFRRPSEAEKPLPGIIGVNLQANVSTISTSEHNSENYFSLYRSPTSNSKVKHDSRLSHLRELYTLSKTLFDYIGPQEYGISPDEKLSIGLLTSLPLLKEIVHDLEEMQASDGGSSFFYFTKESHVYTLLNCIIEGGIKTKIERKNIPELDYLSQINFELYESQNAMVDEEEGKDRYNYSIRITISPGCHTFDPLDLTLDSKHCIGIAPRRSLTAHVNYKDVLETLKTKFHTVKLPKSFIAINLSEISPQLFGPVRKGSSISMPDEQIHPAFDLTQLDSAESQGLVAQSEPAQHVSTENAEHDDVLKKEENQLIDTL